MPNRPISASGLDRNPQNIYIYSSGYDPAPSLTSDYFSVFEIASNTNKRIQQRRPDYVGLSFIVEQAGFALSIIINPFSSNKFTMLIG